MHASVLVMNIDKPIQNSNLKDVKSRLSQEFPE